MTLSLNIRRVLIVDDDEAILRQNRQALEKHSVKDIVTCSSAEEAIAALENGEKFDAGIFDMRMPAIAGSTLIQVVHDHDQEKIRTLPVLMMLGVSSEAEIRLLGELHYSHHIVKPFRDEDLLARLNQAIWETNNPASELGFVRSFANALDHDDLDAAKEMLTPKLHSEGKTPRNMIFWARLLMAAKSYEKAEELVHDVLTKKPDFLPALNLAAKLCIKQGRQEEALVYLEKAQKVSPLNIGRLISMGNLHLDAGKPEEAEGKFKSALKLHPKHKDAKIGLAQALCNQGQYDDSKEVLRSVEDPYEVVSLMNMKAVMLARAGMFEEALGIYDSARKILIQPEKEHLIVFNKAVALYRKGDIDSAKKCAEESARLAPFEKAQKFLAHIEKTERLAKDTKTTNSGGIALPEGLGEKILEEEVLPISSQAFKNATATAFQDSVSVMSQAKTPPSTTQTAPRAGTTQVEGAQAAPHSHTDHPAPAPETKKPTAPTGTGRTIVLPDPSEAKYKAPTPHTTDVDVSHPATPQTADNGKASSAEKPAAQPPEKKEIEQDAYWKKSKRRRF